jgi:hypothetical protein
MSLDSKTFISFPDKQLCADLRSAIEGHPKSSAFCQLQTAQKVIKTRDFKSFRTRTYRAPACNPPAVITLQIARGVWGVPGSNFMRLFSRIIRFCRFYAGVTIDPARMPLFQRGSSGEAFPACSVWCARGDKSLGEGLPARGAFADKSLGERLPVRGAFTDKSLGERLPARGAFADKKVWVS